MSEPFSADEIVDHFKAILAAYNTYARLFNGIVDQTFTIPENAGNPNVLLVTNLVSDQFSASINNLFTLLSMASPNAYHLAVEKLSLEYAIDSEASNLLAEVEDFLKKSAGEDDAAS